MNIFVEGVDRHNRVHCPRLSYDLDVSLVDLTGSKQTLGTCDELLYEGIRLTNRCELRPPNIIVHRKFDQDPIQDGDRIGVLVQPSLNCSSSQMARCRCSRPVQATPYSVCAIRVVLGVGAEAFLASLTAVVPFLPPRSAGLGSATVFLAGTRPPSRGPWTKRFRSAWPRP